MENAITKLDEQDANFLASFDGIEVLPAAAAGVPIAVSVDVSKVITAIAGAYTQTTIVREEQKTEREKYRRLAEIMTAQMQEETKRFEIQVKDFHERHMAIINKICELASNPVISQETLTLVKMLLDYLLQDSQRMTIQTPQSLDLHL